MKNWLKYILLAMVAFCSMNAQAKEPVDTVYFYDSWSDMMNLTPSEMIVSPVIEMINPFEIDIYTTTNDYRLYDHQAVSLGDTTWLVSGVYLHNNFKGDVRDLGSYKYYPVFFNEKVAYLTSVRYEEDQSVLNLLFGTLDDEDLEPVVVFYYLDFMNRKVRKVTPTVLSELLEDYHDLQMRYDGMKDHKKPEIIEEYFYKFIDRATDDIMRPYIMDLVDK